MKRVYLPLLAAVLAYIAYASTLPAATVEEARAMAETSARATLVIDLPAAQLYCACFGVYPDEGTARAEGARYVARGAAGYVRPQGDAFLALASAYGTEGDARAVCAHITEDEGILASVYAFEAKALSVRVTATERQLAALHNAVAALGRYPEEMNALALRMDGGELDSGTARALVEVALTELGRLERELRISLADTDDRFATGLYGLLNNLTGSIRAISQNQGLKGLALSSALKYNYIGARLGIIDFMNGLE